MLRLLLKVGFVALIATLAFLVSLPVLLPLGILSFLFA